MKKTLLATAIVGAMGATAAAQAATVYDQDGTKLDIYGRIALGIAGGGSEYTDTGVERNADADFVDAYSRLGLNLTHDITSDLTGFGRLEWRFRADGDDNRFDAFHETRQSYLGLKSKQFGTIQAGNFDAFYNQFVSLPFDVYIDRGLEFAGHPTQSRGDSIGYYTPEMSGFTAFLQAKHYSNRGTTFAETTDADGNVTNNQDAVDEDTTVAAQGGVRYATGPLTLGLGFVDDVEEAGGNSNDEMLYGATAAYAFTDAFSARLGYETRDNNDDRADNAAGVSKNGYDTWGIGASYATGQWAFNVDYYNVDLDDAGSRDSWAAGAYYTVSSNFNVFAEVQDADAPTLDRDVTLGDLTDDVYWITGARYMF
ncbi:porin [Halomonas sp. Bachu 37]|uniref:porin n=1 Tax=Halomonas kashgarensis TaxID=3084920 RepID=UPI003217453B